MLKRILGIKDLPKQKPKRIHTVSGISSRSANSHRSSSRQYRDYDVDPLHGFANISTSTKHSDTKHHDSSSDSGSDYSCGSSDTGGSSSD